MQVWTLRGKLYYLFVCWHGTEWKFLILRNKTHTSTVAVSTALMLTLTLHADRRYQGLTPQTTFVIYANCLVLVTSSLQTQTTRITQGLDNTATKAAIGQVMLHLTSPYKRVGLICHISTPKSKYLDLFCVEMTDSSPLLLQKNRERKKKSASKLATC